MTGFACRYCWGQDPLILQHQLALKAFNAMNANESVVIHTEFG